LQLGWFTNMGRADYYKSGDYNAKCSMCGTKYKAGELVRNWQGMYRCRECDEPRHPQDFVRNVMDIQTVPWAQDDLTAFTQISCTLWSRSAIPNWATPSCMIPGALFPGLVLGVPPNTITP
jgi:hypothetical protein